MPKLVGLVGGLGPEATVDYYRRILGAWKERYPGSAPRMIVDSLDVQRVMQLVETDRAAMADYVLGSVKRLEAAGADFAVITSSSTHLVFDSVASRASIPMISLVETCADEAERRGLKRCALIGARFAMEADLYPNAFGRRGLEIVVPDKPDRDWIHDRYVNQLLHGDLRDETRNEFVALARRLRETRDIDAVILGGTELPPLLRAPTIADLPVLDTTGLHVAAIVERLA
jgi:aspartate racemase